MISEVVGALVVVHELKTVATSAHSLSGKWAKRTNEVLTARLRRSRGRQRGWLMASNSALRMR
jgi:hypothetical protein